MEQRQRGVYDILFREEGVKISQLERWGKRKEEEKGKRTSDWVNTRIYNG